MKAAARYRFDKESHTIGALANGTYTIAGQPAREFTATDGGLFLLEEDQELYLYFGASFNIQNDDQDLRISLTFKIPRSIPVGAFHPFPKGPYRIESEIFDANDGHPYQVAAKGNLNCRYRTDHTVGAVANCTFQESEGYPDIELHVANIEARG